MPSREQKAAEQIERYLLSNEVQRRYATTRRTLLRWIGDPRVRFPRPVKFSPGGVNHWPLSALINWERQRAALSDE